MLTCLETMKKKVPLYGQIILVSRSLEYYLSFDDFVYDI